MEFLWVLLAVGAALGSAGYMLVNQYAQVNGFHLTIFIKTFIAICFLPFLFLIHWPDQLLFYLFVVLTVPLSIFGDRITFNLIAEYGGGPVSRITPLFLVIVFVFWLIISPEQAQEYWSKPLVFAGICASIIAAVYFASRMRQCEISYAVFKRLVPVIFAYAVITILNKMAMDHSGLHGGVFAYIFVQSVLTSVIGLSYIIWNRKKSGRSADIVSASIVKASAMAGAFMLFHMMAKNYAYATVSDPTFPTAVLLTTPLWIMAYYVLVGYKEKTDIWAGLGVVASVAILVLMQAL